MNVIYIIGTGRTGTTLLGMALGNNKAVFDTGELLKFVKLKGEPHGFDASSANYKFWHSIYHKLHTKIKIDEKLESLIHRVEYHKYFFKNFFGGSKNEGYNQYINNLFSILEDSFEESYIVDSSKYPGRALALKKNLEDKHHIQYVYIKRNPMSVVNSFGKKNVEQPPKGFFAANMYYFMVNLCCSVFLSSVKKQDKITIKYEDFTAKPEQVLTAVQNKFKVDLSNSIELIKENKELKTGFIFEGNRIRLKSGVVLRKSDKKISPNGIKDYLTLLINGFWYYKK